MNNVVRISWLDHDTRRLRASRSVVERSATAAIPFGHSQFSLGDMRILAEWTQLQRAGNYHPVIGQALSAPSSVEIREGGEASAVCMLRPDPAGVAIHGLDADDDEDRHVFSTMTSALVFLEAVLTARASDGDASSAA